MKNKILNICNFYVLLWFLLKSQGVLYDNVYVSVTVYGLILVISFYYAARCFIAKDNLKFVKIYNALFAIFLIYGFINVLIGNLPTTFKQIEPEFYLHKVFQSMLPFYAFYGFAKQGYISKRWLCTFGILFLLLSITVFYTKENALLEMSSKYTEGVTNNVGYTFVVLLPLFCFWDKNRTIQFVFILICSYFFLISMKRGAILSGALSLLYFFFSIYNEETNTAPRKKIKRNITILVLTVVFVFIGYHFIVNMMDTNAYFMARLYDTRSGYSSQRDYLFSYYWDLFLNDSSFIEFIFGRGADGTIHTGHNYAHNDWLEIIINQGLVGIILFVFYWLNAFLLWKKYPKNILKVAFGMCLLSSFVRTLFSMSINDMSIYVTCILGLAIAAYQHPELMKRISD